MHVKAGGFDCYFGTLLSTFLQEVKTGEIPRSSEGTAASSGTYTNLRFPGEADSGLQSPRLCQPFREVSLFLTRP